MTPPLALSGWRTQSPATWPAWAREWAGVKGSLTLALQSTGKEFSVRKIDQGRCRLQSDLAPALKIRSGTSLAQRRVVLNLDGIPVVAARTLMARKGPRNDWPFWNGLGNRSLGHRLFRDSRVSRGPVCYQAVSSRRPWVRSLLEQADAQIQAHRHCLVRATCFTRRPGVNPLWVFEIFLPSLNGQSIGMTE